MEVAVADRLAAARAVRWSGTTPEQRKAELRRVRQAQAIAEVRRMVAESRRAQGLAPTVESERFLDELAADVARGSS
jgi:hypothetical protein